MMEQEKYLATRQQLLTISALVADLSLREFIAAIETAETVGIFMVSPAKYKEATVETSLLQDLARDLIPLQKRVLKERSKFTTAPRQG